MRFWIHPRRSYRIHILSMKNPILGSSKAKIWHWFRISSPFISQNFRFSVKCKDLKLTYSNPFPIPEQKSNFSYFSFDLQKIRDDIPLDQKFEADSESAVRLFLRIFVFLYNVGVHKLTCSTRSSKKNRVFHILYLTYKRSGSYPLDPKFYADSESGVYLFLRVFVFQ